MKKILSSIFLTISFGLLLSQPSIFAQDPTHSPLVIHSGEQLLTWDGNALEVPEEAPCNGLDFTASPINSCLHVFTLIETDWLNAEREPFGGGPETPINIALRDDANGGETQIIADQPEDYFIKDDGHAENFIVRGRPAWSPDGTQLVWTELRAPGANLTLVVYNLERQTLTDLVQDVPPAVYTVGGPLDVYWSTQDIILETVVLDETANPVSAFLLIEPFTGKQKQYELPPLEPMVMGLSTSAGAVREIHRFFTDEGIVLLYEDARWQVLYWDDGRHLEIDGGIDMVSAANPDGLKVRITVDQELNRTWTMLTPDGDAIQLDVHSIEPEQIAISPNGTQLAYINSEDKVLVWQDGEFIDVAIATWPNRVWWSHLVWHIPD